MEKVKFLVFKEKVKDQLDRDLLFFTCSLTGLTMLWLGGEDYFSFKFLETLGTFILSIAISARLFFLFYSLSEKEMLNGNLVGCIEFEKDKVTVGDQEFYLRDIAKIEVFYGDFDGRKIGSGYSLEPKVSNGVANLLKIKTKENFEFEFNFQLNYENEFEKKMRDLLISYHLKDKISFLALIQYIGISDSYERIQEFKKELEALRMEQA